jgi:5-methyltetrahydropteroyltriglutamate--homocysteine methyltransferase
MLKARTDIVGSLLRPPVLIEARNYHHAGTISDAAFKRVEDRAVDGAIEAQEAAGLEVVTDGEMRRESFQSQMTEAIGGFGEYTIDAFLWGNWRGDESVGDKSVERPSQLGIKDQLYRKRHLSVEEFVYARAKTDRTIKVTLPSPTLFANFWQADAPDNPYPSLDRFLDHVTIILREEVEELIRLGCTYIQIDAPHYPLLIAPETRAFYESQGWDIDRWLQRGIELDNEIMVDHPEVTYAFHLCRGNQGSRWLVSGSYEPIAEQIFTSIKAERLMLEYDDERSGDYAPLRFVPEDKMVVLGLVTTKSAYRETVDELRERIDRATEYIPLDRLAISPQCGFATSIIGNNLTVADQQYKLNTLVETAHRVWGETAS